MKSEFEGFPNNQTIDSQALENRTMVNQAWETSRTIPVIAEQLDIQKRRTVTGIVRVEKTVHTSNAQVDEELTRETVTVTRVPINQDLTEPAVTRQEGDTTIIPIMEEVVVVSKRLVLKEEIRITRHKEVSRHQETVALRTEDVHIQRQVPSVPADGASLQPELTHPELQG